MALNRQIKTDMFVAESKAGERYRIVEYTEMIEVKAMGKREELPGLKRLMTTDRLPVNKNNDGTYEIVESGIVIKRTNGG